MRREATLLVAAAMVLSAGFPVLVAGEAPMATETPPDGLNDGSSEPVPYQTGSKDPIALNSGTEYWAGTTLRFDGSEVVPDVSEASDRNRTFQIWSVDSAGNTESLLGSFTVRQNGTAEIGTDTLRDRVVILYDGDPVYVTDGVGYADTPPDGTDVTVESSAWRVEGQEFEAVWHDRRVFEGQVGHLDLTSNREAYDVAVSATIDGDPLQYEELARLFDSTAYAADHDARREQNELVLSAGASSDYRVNSSWLPAERVQFEFDVVDTTARDSASLRIETPSGTPRILSTGGSRVAGDTLSVRVACDQCFLVLGRGAPGTPLDLLELTDQDGDDVVEVEINTRYAGLVASAVPGEAGAAYDAGPDNVYRYDTSDRLEDRDRQTGSAFISEVRDAVGIAPSGLSEVISPGDLTVHIASSDYLISREKYGASTPPPGRPLVVVDETDATTLFLRDRSLTDVRTVPLPRTAAAAENPTRAFATTTERSAVAIGDQLLFSIDASGIYGYLATRSDPLSAMIENENEGLDLALAPTAGGARVPNDAVRAATELEINRTEERVYGIVDTGELDREANIDVGTEYTLSFQLTGGGETVAGDDTDGYPYLPPGEVETASTSVLFQNRSVTVSSPDPENAVVENQDRVTVSGETTIASGTTLSLRAEALDPYAWSTATSIEVDADRQWTGTLDFSGAPGSEYNVEVIDGSTKRTSFRLELTSTTATATADPGDGTATQTETTGGTGTTTTGTGTTTDAGTAGTATGTASDGADTTSTAASGTAANQTISGNQTESTASATAASGDDGTPGDGTDAPAAPDGGNGIVGGILGTLPTGLPIVEVGGVLVAVGVLFVVVSRLR